MHIFRMYIHFQFLLSSDQYLVAFLSSQLFQNILEQFYQFHSRASEYDGWHLGKFRFRVDADPGWSWS